MVESNFQESHGAEVLAPVAQAEGKEWDVVLIQPGWSTNGYFYPASVLRESVSLFEDLQACAYHIGNKFNHVPREAISNRPNGFAENIVGWFENIKYGTFKNRAGKTSEGVLGRFHVMEGAKWLRENLRDAWKHGKSRILGFSIDAFGLGHKGQIQGKSGMIVETIEEIRSTDVVNNPAAGGEIIRLVAGVQEDLGMKDFYIQMQESFPAWLEGWAEPENEDDLEDHIIRVLEANTAKAEDELAVIPKDEIQHLAETVRGVKSLTELNKLIRDGKIQESVTLLRTWRAAHPDRTQNIYSFPYSAAHSRVKKEVVMTEAVKNQETEVEEVELDEAGHLEEKKKKKKEEELRAAKERESALTKRERDIHVKESVLESTLPKKGQQRVLKLLTSRDGEISDEEIETAITEEKDYIASFSESGEVTGLGDAHGDQESAVEVLQEQREKWDKAWDGYFAGGMNKVDGVEPFHSLKQGYAAICGRYLEPLRMAYEIYRSCVAGFPRFADVDLDEHHSELRESWNGMKRHIGLREAITTSDFSVGFGQALFRRLQRQYDKDPRQDWQRFASSIETLQDITNTFTLVRIGGIGDLSVVAEGAPYQEITPVQSEETEVMTPQKFGGLKKFTLETVLADRLNIIRRIPDDLALAAMRTFHKDFWDEVETNPVIQGNALLSANNNNLITGALSYAKVVEGVQLVQDQTEQDSGETIGLDATWLLTGTKLRSQAWEITNSDVKASGSEDATLKNFLQSIGMQSMATLGLGRTTATDDHFWVATEPREAETIAVGFLGGRRTPEIFIQSPESTPTAGAAFTADEMTFKIRHIWGVKLVDWRWISGSLQ